MQHTHQTDHTPNTEHSTPPHMNPTHAKPRWLRSILQEDDGASTAEYAVVVLAAVALAGVLVTIVRSAEVQAMLLDLVQRAFAAAG